MSVSCVSILLLSPSNPFSLFFSFFFFGVLTVYLLLTFFRDHLVRFHVSGELYLKKKEQRSTQKRFDMCDMSVCLAGCLSV